MLVKSDVIKKVGLLDESLFSYAEDLDWSIRIGLRDYQIFYEPLAKVWHKVASRARREGTSYVALYLATRNVLKVQFRYARWYHCMIFVLWFGLSWIGYMSLKSLMNGDLKGVVGIFKGMVDSFGERNRYAD
jgi:GT2 family glycosyltransferase